MLINTNEVAKIGIGITTYNRRDNLNECLKNIAKHTNLKDLYVNGDVTLYVATDTDEDRRGVAFRKNECLRALKDCDYVFLFDDDTFPIKDGWIEFFTSTGIDHLMYLDRRFHRYIKDNVYADCGGVMLFMSRKAIDKVGAFDEKFDVYGFEHADWSSRFYEDKEGYMSLLGTDEYIYSHDYSTPNHKSSITDEEKQKCIKNNWDKFFNSEIKDVYLPL